MSAKRPAEQQIDQKTHEYVTPSSTNQPHTQSSATQRVIVEIKRDSDGPIPKTDQEKSGEPTKTEQKEKTMPLFSNLFQNNSNNGVGLFGNIGLFNAANAGLQKQTPKIDFKSSSLFTGNGFASSANTPKNPFAVSNNQSSIFGFGQGANIPPVRNGEDDEDGDSAELEKAQTMSIDKSKSKGHYDYKDEVKVLFSGIARKYKKNNGDLVENVEIVLQHDKQSKLVYFMVRLQATKHNIFTGYILKNKSQVRILNKKNENLQVSVFEIVKGKTAELHKIKIQLDTPENGKLLFNQLNDAINGKLVIQQSQPKAETEAKLTQVKQKQEEKKQQPLKKD